ncbi:hypothetical protein ckin119_09800 [Helicobacter pylori]
MKANTIILVDWENFRRDIKQTKCVNYNIALDVIVTIRAFLLDDEWISRIYFIPPHPLILNMRYGIKGTTPSKMKKIREQK